MGKTGYYQDGIFISLEEHDERAKKFQLALEELKKLQEEAVALRNEHKALSKKLLILKQGGIPC